MPSHGVDFIDEDDAGRMLLGLLEHVAHARRTDADEHFDEIGAGNREKRHFGLAGNCAGQQRLARAGRTDHEHAFGDLAAELLKLARILQEVDDFDDLLLGLLDARHVREGDVDLVLAQEACATLAERHGAAAPGCPLHLAHEIGPETDQDQDRERRDEQLQQNRLLFRRLAAKLHALGLQQPDQRAVAGLGVVGHEGVTGAPLALDVLPFQRYRLDIAALHFRQELRVIDRRRLPGAHAELAENREQNDRQRDP